MLRVQRIFRNGARALPAARPSALTACSAVGSADCSRALAFHPQLPARQERPVYHARQFHLIAADAAVTKARRERNMRRTQTVVGSMTKGCRQSRRFQSWIVDMTPGTHKGSRCLLGKPCASPTGCSW